MQVLLLAYETAADFAKRSDPAAFQHYMGGWFAYSSALEASGALRGGGALQGPETATCVRVRDGRRMVEDGPFSDAKEQLGGYFMLETDTVDAAARLAAGCPAAKTGRVDVRGVPDYGQER